MRRLRVRLGFTQEELAERAHIEARYLQEVERARTNFTLLVLVGLADALGVDPRVLMRAATLRAPRSGRPPSTTKRVR